MREISEEAFVSDMAIFSEIRRVIALEMDPTKVQIAVAYFGSRASKLVNFPRGCTLIVNLSLDNMLSGSVDPAEVRKVMNEGVRVEACDGLHAKVVLTSSHAIVGSANLSRNAHDNLSEAAISTTNPDVRERLGAFIKDLPNRYPLSLTFVDHCVEKSRQLRREHSALKEQNKLPTMQAWVLNTIDKEPDKATSQEADRHLGKVLDAEGVREMEYLHYSTKEWKDHLTSVAVGDLVFDARRSDGDGNVLWSPREVRLIKHISVEKTERVYLYFARHENSDNRDLDEAKKTVGAQIPDLGESKMAVKLSLCQMSCILGLWDEMPSSSSAAA
jgi:hypothetical protein